MQAFFGSLPVVAKVVLGVIPAVSLVGLRVGITAVVLVAVQIVRGRLASRQSLNTGLAGSPPYKGGVDAASADGVVLSSARSDAAKSQHALFAADVANHPVGGSRRHRSFPKEGSLRLRQRADYLKLAILSLFGVTFNQLLFIGGLSRTKASNTSLLAVTIPIFALTVGALIGSERLRLVKVVGIAVAALGVLLIIDPRNASFSSDTTRGDLMIVLNSLSFGIYVATSKSVVTRNGAFRSMMWVFVFAAMVCVPLGAYSYAAAGSPELTAGVWLIILYIALGATAAPYLLNAWAIQRVPPSTLAVFIYLQPLIGFLLAVVFLGEKVGAGFLLAALLIFAGVFLVTRKLEGEHPARQRSGSA